AGRHPRPGSRRRWGEDLPARRQPGTGGERDEQQESDADDHRERPETLLDDADHATPRPGRNAPDGVQRVLQLPEDAPEPKQEREDPKAGGDEAAAGAAGILDRCLNRLGPCEADKVLYLVEDLALRRFLPEQERGDGDDDDQPRCQREDRVERECRPQPRRPVFVPLEDRLTEQRPDDPRGETRRRPVDARREAVRHQKGTDTPSGRGATKATRTPAIT